MKNNKRKVVFLSFFCAFLLLTIFGVCHFSFSNKSQTSNVSEQTTPTPSIQTQPLTTEEKIYNELTGNLKDSFSEDEKVQIQNLIKEIVNVENNSNDNAKKSNVYKEIIKILDDVTLRAHSQEDLDKYKKYYDITKNSSNFTPECYTYRITSTGEISTESSTFGEVDNAEHKKLWENTKKIIPFELLKGIKYFTPFNVDKTSGAYVGGFMQPLDWSASTYEWNIGVESSAAESENLPYTLIHEYGHYISLKDSTIDLNDNINSIKADGSELLKSFVESCLKYTSEELENIEPSKHYLFYARHKDDFVTKYAAENLLEDFAESFAKFVKGVSYDSETLKGKMNFFKNRQDMVDIKNKILNSLENNGIKEIVEITT